MGFKSLAWVIVLVMLALFATAMGEVGNSLPLYHSAVLGEHQHWNPTANHSTANRALGHYFDRAGNTFFVARDWLSPRGRLVQLVRIEIDGDDRIASVAKFDLRETPDMVPSNYRALLDYAILGIEAVNEQEFLVTITEVNNIRDISDLVLQKVRWLENDTPTIHEQQRIRLPTTDHRWLLEQHVLTDQYAFILYVHPGPDKSRAQTLFVFDLESGPKLSPLFQVPIGRGARISVHDNRLSVMWHSGNWHEWQLADFDLDDVSSLASRDTWNITPISPPLDRGTHFTSFFYFGGNSQWVPNSMLWSAVETRRPGWYALADVHNGMWDEVRQLAYVTDILGLRVLQQSPTGRWNSIGEYRASPLAMAYRKYGTTHPLVLIDGNLLIEPIQIGIIVYDLSEPARPRRIGFNTQLSGTPQHIDTTEDHLVVFTDNAVHIFDRP